MPVFNALRYLGLALLLAACSNKRESKPLSAENLYGTYIFTIDDAQTDIACLFQFSADKSKKGLFLPEGAKIRLDGYDLKGDSISIGEVYYESALARSSWPGTHQIRLFTENGNELAEDLTTQSVSLVNDIPGTINRKGWTIRLAGLSETDKIQLALVDTAFNTNDLHIDTSLSQPSLTVDSSRFSDLEAGPLVFYLMVEKHQPLRKLKGEAIVRYLFRKDIELTN